MQRTQRRCEKPLLVKRRRTSQKRRNHLKRGVFAHLEDFEGLVVEDLLQLAASVLVVLSPPLNGRHWFALQASPVRKLELKCFAQVGVLQQMDSLFTNTVHERSTPVLTSELHVMLVIFPAHAKNSLGWSGLNRGLSEMHNHFFLNCAR